jgi:hypothetical protein
LLSMNINLPQITIEMVPPWNNLYRFLNSPLHGRRILPAQRFCLILTAGFAIDAI